MPIITEVENHGEFVWRSSNAPDATPEFWDGHGASYSEVATCTRTLPDGAGAWLPFAEITFTGTVKAGDSFSLNWITRNLETGYEENRGAAGVFPRDCDAETAALLAGSFINGNVDTQAAQAEGVLRIFPVGEPDEINVGEPVLTPAAP